MEKDYYQILGIPRDAPEREIKKAYYALATKLHPDKAPDADTRRRNEDELALVSAAYNALKDSAKRAEYDVSLRGKKDSSRESTQVPLGASKGAPGAPTPNPSGSSGGGSGSGAASASSASKASSAQAASTGALKGQDLVAKRVGIAEKAFAKGIQLLNTNDYAGAVPFFEAAIQNDDSKHVYYIKLALALIRSRGSYTKAAEAAARAIEMDAYNVEYKLIFAEIHETAGAVTAAKKAYEDALKWDPNNVMAKSRLQELKGGGSKSFFVGLFKKLTQKG